MSTITAAVIAYNEEQRIEHVLRSLIWCDEIIVLDKSSTDRTREIAARYTDRILIAPYSDFDVAPLRRLRDASSSEWILWAFASDLVTVALAEQVRALICRADFDYDVIDVPFRRYALGVTGPRSPWHHDGWHPAIVRRSKSAFRDDDVHQAIGWASDRIYRMKDDGRAYMYHLTHASIDMMMERHVRYCRAEGELTAERVPLGRAALSVVRAVVDVVFRRRTLLLGWRGIALSFAYISYWMLRFLYIWERKRSNVAEVYSDIREEVLGEWERRKT